MKRLTLLPFQRLRTHRNKVYIAVAACSVVLIMRHPRVSPGGWGIGPKQSVVTETEQKLSNGQTQKTITTNKSGKTMWDWFSLLGVPLSLALLGAWFQASQQKQASATAREQREQAESEAREDVLQLYFDRISVLLVDKNLLGDMTARKAEYGEIPQNSSIQEDARDAAVDVIRARTLSILRRFSNDAERKTSVVLFLIETEIIGKLKLNLSGANLSKAKLEGACLTEAKLFRAKLEGACLTEAKLEEANLSGARLEEANLAGANLAGANLAWAFLTKAKLNGAELYGANLQGVNLEGAILRWANLSGAKLYGTNLSGANLECANLECANLEGANLSGANLTEAKLSGANLRGANLECANLEWANLEGAKLEWAKLRGANLEETIIEGIKLTKDSKYRHHYNYCSLPDATH